MSTPLRKGHCSTERLVRARKPNRCAWCGGPIPAGSQYVVVTEFPGGEAGYADHAGHPVRMAVHAAEPCYCMPEVTS